MPIKVMPDALASRVAAGEVVERPVSVVKELVENSLDAGASRIDIEIEGGGMRLIRVVDDGHGIPEEELALAFERFATSKVDESSDLLAIPTLGFRGEALPSVAAVADVTAISRHVESDRAAECNVVFGSEAQVLAAGAPIGTSIAVRQLFRNLPARRKFLGSEASESSRIASLVGQLALIRSDVKFRLTIDGAVRLHTAGDFDDTSALAVVHRVKTLASLVNLDATLGASFRVAGALAMPEVHFGRRTNITIAVNGRLVQSYRLVLAVERGYQGFLPERRFPMALIKAEVPHEDVDVNVHPQKTEVRFRREGLVFSVIEKAVRDSLGSHAPVRQFSNSRIASSLTTSLEGTFGARNLDNPSEFSGAVGDPDESVSADGEYDDRTAIDPTIVDSASVPSTSSASGCNGTPPPSARHRDVLPELRVLGQVRSTYIVAESPNGVFLIDQHAAHERVKFEEVKAKQAQKASESQLLLSPHVVDLSPQRAEVYSEGAQWFADAGWAIEPFGGDSMIVRAVPQLLADRVARETSGVEGALFRVLDDLTLPDVSQRGSRDMPWSERLLATMACHAAVRAGDSLSLESCERIVSGLQACEHPQSCPHGRPTMLLLSSDALAREFERA